MIARADGVGGSAAPNEGPPGPHSEYADVATPFGGQLCDCHEAEGDGTIDLSMKFRTDDVVSALQLDGLAAGSFVELSISGMLVGGGLVQGCDCVRLVPPHDLNADGTVDFGDLLILPCAGDSGATVDMVSYELQGTSCDFSNIMAVLASWQLDRSAANYSVVLRK